MGLPKSKNTVGLGNSLMNDRFGKGKGSDMRRGNYTGDGIVRQAENGETYVTNNKKEAAWVKMRSVTEQAALDEFLTTAQLAGTDFTAEKANNVKIIKSDVRNPFLLTADEERAASRKIDKYKLDLIVPRRPKWDSSTTRDQLDQLERESFMQWRRKLAFLQEGEDLLMTPFERNLEVWRQLWRVVERSDLVVQIVDGRNPLHFRSEDLERYVTEIDPTKRNLLLVNKADMLSVNQRRAWAQFFVSEGINFRFFSAELAKEENEKAAPDSDFYDSEADSDDESDSAHPRDLPEADKNTAVSKAPSSEDGAAPDDAATEAEPVELTESQAEDELVRIMTTDELESLFIRNAPSNPKKPDGTDRKIQIGLVGYPNVGKSSTINALLGAKKVSVSATPGKTKHFQTIHLSDQIVLCDCPGLVFPNFATTKAELVCNGVLPIDQLREYTGPSGLVAHRVPTAFIEAVYGIAVPTRSIADGGTGIASASDILRAYARARGFATTGLGQPDESRAARFILKDYVRGRLPYVHPPPSSSSDSKTDKSTLVGQESTEDGTVSSTSPIDATEFNRELYDVAHLPANRRGAFEDESGSNVVDGQQQQLAGLSILETHPNALTQQQRQKKLTRTDEIDRAFFAQQNGVKGQMTKPFHNQYTQQGMVKHEAEKEKFQTNRKKHFKGGQKKKLAGKGNSFMED